MGNRPIYCGLPRTSVTSMHCTKLVCEVRSFFFAASNKSSSYITLYRCQGHRTDLDGDLSKFPRTRHFTEEVIEHHMVSELWDDFGIVSDVIVWMDLILLCDICESNNFQPFTNDFKRADIHELLAPDLLHQVIKGTFKDHLVTWVHDYLYATHSKSRADEILDDIDQR